jgi:polysaccharide pyruvyl transferase WcaK-like protein
MNLNQFLHDTDLHHSLLIGYYGGGNYGDELLLEVLSNLMARQGVQDVTVTYQRPETYPGVHHDFGFNLINIHDRKAVLRASLKSKKILIGGGGLWGVDMNLNTLILSLFLFVSRWVLRKKIYLLGVGYYQSTNRMGRIGAWLAGKSANVILARDDESARNFGRINKRTFLDTDIAWQTRQLDLSTYQKEALALEKKFPVGHKTLLVALRRPQSKRQHHAFQRFNKLISWLISSNPSKPIILVMLESDTKDADAYEQARALRRRHKHLRIIETPYNPLTLFSFIQQNHSRLALIAPQLHLIMTAHLSGVPFLPITYDNKVSGLLDQIGIPAEDRLTIDKVSGSDLLEFAGNFFGGKNS